MMCSALPVRFAFNAINHDRHFSASISPSDILHRISHNSVHPRVVHVIRIDGNRSSRTELVFVVVNAIQCSASVLLLSLWQSHFFFYFFTFFDRIFVNVRPSCTRGIVFSRLEHESYYRSRKSSVVASRPTDCKPKIANPSRSKHLESLSDSTKLLGRRMPSLESIGTCEKYWYRILITGRLRPTEMHKELHTLSGIATPDLRITEITEIESNKCNQDSRQSAFKSLQRATESLPLPGQNLKYETWKTLNRLRIGVVRTKKNLVKWTFANAEASRTKNTYWNA